MFTYNANGTVATAIDAKGATTTFGYDVKGNPTSIAYPSPRGAESMTYDSLSRLETRTDGKSQTTTYSYDALDRVTTLSYQDGSTITFGYDANGNRTSRVDGTGASSYGFDTLNRITTEAKPGTPMITYGYDEAGRLTSLSNASGITTYSYDNAGRLNSILEPNAPNSLPIEYSYPDETHKTITYPNHASMASTYDLSGRLLSVFGRDGVGLTRTSHTYTYTYVDSSTGAPRDSNLRQSVADLLGNLTNYSYDTVGRLKRAVTTGPFPADRQYCYDPNGNLVSRSTTCAPIAYTYNSANELTSSGYNFDANGNETSSPSLPTLSYNAKNQTASITTLPLGLGTISMTYAGSGQAERTQAGPDTFVNDLLGLGIRTTAGSSTYYTREPGGRVVGQRTPVGHFYFLFDGIGSVMALTESVAGAVVGTYSYDPYGNPELPRIGPLNPFGFAGYYWDDAEGLYKVGERYYDPQVGRWTQIDPIASPLEEHGWNQYAYAGSDPVNLTDHSGLYFENSGGGDPPPSTPPPGAPPSCVSCGATDQIPVEPGGPPEKEPFWPCMRGCAPRHCIVFAAACLPLLSVPIGGGALFAVCASQSCAFVILVCKSKCD